MKSKIYFPTLIFFFSLHFLFAQNEMVYYQLEEYPYGVKNPMKGFGIDTIQDNHPLATIVKTYIPWKAIEDSPEDDLKKILDYCEIRWREKGTFRDIPGWSPARDGKNGKEYHGMIPDDYKIGNHPSTEAMNIRIVPRVCLQFSPTDHVFLFDTHTASKAKEMAFPQGLEEYDYYSPDFCARVDRLVEKLAQAWDNDPRVINVEMGLIGPWGEQHTPFPSKAVEQCLGDAFSQYFKNKHVLIRWADQFQDYDFGIYADSWGHDQDRGYEIALLGDRWKTKPITGEVAYNWGSYKIQPGETPDSSVIAEKHRSYLIHTIRTLHCSYLFWIGRYDWRNPTTKAGADEIQKAFGYRYVIDSVGFTPNIKNGELKVTFEVTNTGSAPFYYSFPVEVVLLHAKTKKKVWGKILENVDIRNWQPGNFWNPNFNQYMEAPKEFKVAANLPIGASIKKGDYILAIGILEPSVQRPAIRFANTHYLNGGYCPLGMVSVGKKNKQWQLQFDFDDINADDSINYKPNK